MMTALTIVGIPMTWLVLFAFIVSMFMMNLYIS